RRMLVILAVSLVPAGILQLILSRSDQTGVVTASSESTEITERRLADLRKVAATVRAREGLLQQAATDLAGRARGILRAETAAQAQAARLETARRLGKNEQIEIRTGDFGAPKALGDYGLVYATVTFECRVEQLVNFLAALSHEPDLIVPSEERITTTGAK